MDKNLDLIHVKIHALRMQEDYKPTKFEYELNKLIAEIYQKDCEECKTTAEKLKHQSYQKQSFFGGMFK